MAQSEEAPGVSCPSDSRARPAPARRPGARPSPARRPAPDERRLHARRHRSVRGRARRARLDRHAPLGPGRLLRLRRRPRHPRSTRSRARASLFADAFSHCPLTLPAHASLFTGLLPPTHGVRDNLGFTLDAKHRTLARRFQEAGYATGGAVSAYVLRGATGIADGFSLWDDALETRAGARGDRRPAARRRRRDRGARALRSKRRAAGASSPSSTSTSRTLPTRRPTTHGHHADPYDGEVAYADELVGRLLARLRSAGVYDRAILAVTSDHGEGLMDHGEQEHGFFLYREALQVPLVLRLPGGRKAGTRVTGVAGHADLAATLLDLAGLPADGMDGVSLRGGDRQRPDARAAGLLRDLLPALPLRLERAARRRPRTATASSARRAASSTTGCATRASSRTSRRPGRAVAAMGLARAEGAAGDGRTRSRLGETREALAALGYVGGGAVAAGSPPLPDPKDKLARLRDVPARDAAARSEGRADEALAGLRAVVADSPGLLDAWQALGTTYARLGREREAIAAFDAIVRQDPTNAEAHIALARIHGLAGRRDRAEKHARLASAEGARTRLRDAGRDPPRPEAPGRGRRLRAPEPRGRARTA